MHANTAVSISLFTFINWSPMFRLCMYLYGVTLFFVPYIGHQSILLSLSKYIWVAALCCCSRCVWHLGRFLKQDCMWLKSLILNFNCSRGWYALNWFIFNSRLSLLDWLWLFWWQSNGFKLYFPTCDRVCICKYMQVYQFDVYYRNWSLSYLLYVTLSFFQ